MNIDVQCVVEHLESLLVTTRVVNISDDQLHLEMYLFIGLNGSKMVSCDSLRRVEKLVINMDGGNETGIDDLT